MVNNVDRVLFREDKRTEIVHDLMIRYAVEEELVSSVEMGLNNGPVYEMKDIYEADIATIHERGGNDPRSEKTLKKYLKTRLQQEIEGIEFEKSVQRNTSEYIGIHQARSPP